MVINGGALEHIVAYEQLFQILNEFESVNAELADEKKVQVRIKGMMHVDVGLATRKLWEVYFTPSLRMNTLSCSRLYGHGI